MKAILLLAGAYSSCEATKHIWQDVCLKNDINIEIYDVSQKDGKEMSLKYDIKSFPALIYNNKVIAVGQPDEKSAAKVFQSLLQ